MVDVRADYLSTTQAAAMLGLSESRLRQLTESGALQCVRTPIGRLFPRAVVRDFAAGRGIVVPE